MSSGFSEVNPNVLKFIFNEDRYIVKDQTVSLVPTPSLTKTDNMELPKTAPQVVKETPKQVKKVAVVAGTEKEIIMFQEFLSKILLAVGVKWEDAGFIAFDKKDTSAFEVYLIFGIENQKLVEFKSPIFLNQVQVQENEKYIFTYSLGDLEKSKDKKKGLWTAMQEAFLTK